MTTNATERTVKLEPQPFDVCGPLPRGMTLLQASAGTGKTFTIAALTTRYVAEGVLPIDRLLVITFTRMATGELRERVRERLVRTYDGLVDVLEGTAGHEDDEVVRLLADAPRGEVEARRDRLGKAVADFDAATIETTHGFCLQVLYGLGTAGDVDREVTLVEDVRDLMEEVVDDLYLRKFAGQPNPLGLLATQAMEIAKHVLNHPDAVIVPPRSDASDTPAIRRRFADAVRNEMERRKRNLKILTYDDILMRLQRTLRDPERGRAACARLRERYDVVLVDEFQDTDPVQWDIMHRAFGQGGATLVLIGDPKQAIYAFRGADVHAYLEASEVVRSEWTLDVNWRSDQGLLEAYDALFADAQLGFAGITYRSISAAPPNRAPRLVGAPVSSPLRVRVVRVADGLVALTQTKGQPQAGDARNLIARDLAAEVVRLLEARPEVVTRRRDGSELARDAAAPGKHRRAGPGQQPCRHRPRRVAPGRRPGGHRRERLGLRDAARHGVAPAARGAGAADGPRPRRPGRPDLLHRLERRGRGRGQRGRLGGPALVLAPLGGPPARRGDRVALRGRQPVPRRAGARADQDSGERFLTDLRHIAQLLARDRRLGGPRPDRDGDVAGSPHPRRGARHRTTRSGRGASSPMRTPCRSSPSTAARDSSSRSSCCPYMWDGRPNTNEVPVFHDPAHGNTRTIDVGHEGNDFAIHQKMELDEGRGEDLRLLYVASTRARHQAVLWWAGVQDCQHSPLARLLFERDPQGLVHAYGSGTHTDDEMEAAFRALGPEVSVERVAEPAAVRWHRDEEAPPQLDAAIFDRRLDLGWRRRVVLGHHPRPPRTACHRQRARTTADVRRGPALCPGARAGSGRGPLGGHARLGAGPGRHAGRRVGGDGGAQRHGADRVRRAGPLHRGRRGARP